jgi:hypothetical protein
MLYCHQADSRSQTRAEYCHGTGEGASVELAIVEVHLEVYVVGELNLLFFLLLRMKSD